MNFPSGYARSSRDLVKALEQQGVRIIYRYVYGAGSPFPVEEPEGLGDYWLEVVRSRDLPCNIKTAVVYGQGDVFERNIGKRKIGFTMLEVDGFPAEWVRQANKMDEVWVPTEFNRRGMIDSGVKRPVHVVPLGVDPNYFHPGIEGHPNPYGDFVFLANFEWGERKEPWLLLRAFNETFRRDDPVRLVCKMINKDPGVRVKDEIAKLQLSERGGRIDYLFNIDFPHYQLGSLYRSADCFVSAGRGEGWDMPLMEAMACGLSSIATDWGAHEAFVTDEISYPLRVRGTVPAVAKCPYYVGFEWADPDPDHLRHLLRYVFEHQDEAAEKGRRAAATMVARWTWDQAAAKIVERLEVE
jgi:glycosyltransferase involved in cell wall biosynthesis